MTEAAFYLDRMRRALEKAHTCLQRDDLRRAKAYDLAARHYRTACMVASGRASALDDILEIVQCELEALTYGDEYEDTRLRPGLVHILGVLLKHREEAVEKHG